MGAPRGFSRSLRGMAADLVARSTAMCWLPLVLARPPRASWNSSSSLTELAEVPCNLPSSSVLSDAAALAGLCNCLCSILPFCCNLRLPGTGLGSMHWQTGPVHLESLPSCIMRNVCHAAPYAPSFLPSSELAAGQSCRKRSPIHRSCLVPDLCPICLSQIVLDHGPPYGCMAWGPPLCVETIGLTVKLSSRPDNCWGSCTAWQRLEPAALIHAPA